MKERKEERKKTRSNYQSLCECDEIKKKRENKFLFYVICVYFFVLVKFVTGVKQKVTFFLGKVTN